MNTDLKHKNFAYSTLAASITNVATSLAVEAGYGTRFPSSGDYMLILWDASLDFPSQDSSREIIRCTAISTDTMTIVRGQEGTSAKAWNAGTKLALTITSSYFDQLDSRGINAKRYGSALTKATIDLAIADIGADYTRLYLTPGEWVLDADLEIPANIVLVPVAGATLNGAFTLTVLGGIDCPAGQQCFGDTISVDLSSALIEYAHPGWWGSLPGGGAHTGLQRACDSKAAWIKMLAGRYNVGAATLHSYGSQRLTGVGKYITEIESSDATVCVAVADAAGDYSEAKDVSPYAIWENFSIVVATAGAIGGRWIGISYGQLHHIAAYKDADEGAGARTGVGFHVGGTDDLNRGCFYNSIKGLDAKYFARPYVYGPKAHSNGFVHNVNFHYCDDGPLVDDGTYFSYATVSGNYPVMVNLHGGSIEQINGTALESDSDLTTYGSYSDLYIEGCVDGIIQEAGRTFVSTIRFASMSGDELVANGGSFQSLDADAVTSLVSRSAYLNKSLIPAAFYDATDTLQATSSPRLISFYAIINGNGSDSYASTTVTFATLDADLPATMYVSDVWGNCIGSKAGGLSNALYNIGFSDYSDFAADTDLQINVVRVDGAAMAVDEAVKVKVNMIIYLP